MNHLEFDRVFDFVNGAEVNVFAANDPLDFYSLFTAVIRYGGFHRVIQDRAWQSIW